MYSVIGRSMITSSQFIFFAAKVKTLINKHGIGFKNSLMKVQKGLDLPFPLTPEILVKGDEFPSFNILDVSQDDKDSWGPPNSNPDVHFDYFKDLNILRSKIQSSYENEFLRNFKCQTVNKLSCFKPKCQADLVKGSCPKD